MGRLRRYIFVLLSLCLVVGFNPTTYAANSPKSIEVQEPTKIGTIKLKSDVIAEIKNLQMMPAESNQIIGVTLTVKNNSNAEINFLDYWININTKSGTKLNVQMVDKNVVKIPARSSLDINFYGKTSNNIKLSDLIISVIQWDFSATNYTRVLGQVNVPLRYNPATPDTVGRLIVTENTQASFIVKQSVMGKTENFYRPEIKLIIRNDGKRAITLPDYKMYVMTGDQLMYPINTDNIKGTVLNPLAEKEYQLTVSIPSGVKQSGWKLAVMYPIEEGKINYPLGLFDLPKATNEVAEEAGKFYSFNTLKGIYHIKIDSVNRLPIEEDDLVVANMTIANKGNTSLPVPTLLGKFIFNDSIERTASATNNNKLISIAPGKTANIQLVGRIPYTFDVSKFKLIIQQKESGSGTEAEVKDLVEFTHSGKFDAIRRVTPNIGFSIEDVGYRSEVKARNKMLFSGPSTDMIAVQLTIKNKEKRMTDVQKFAGYFEKADGTVYLATINNVSDKIGPGGLAYVYAWASLPKDTDISDMNLVIGKAVVEKAGSQTNEATENIVGYAEPYSLILPKELEPQKNLQNIEFPPYSLSIKKANTKIDYANNNIQLKLNYDLVQDLLVKADTKNDKIVIELTDSSYKKTNFIKEFSLPAGLGSSSEGALQLGENSLEITWVDDQFVRQIQNLKDYELKIYLQKQPGYKTLIASQTIPWFIDRQLTE